MRLLPVRSGDECGGFAERGEATDGPRHRSGYERQSVSLRHLCPYSRRHQRRRALAGDLTMHKEQARLSRRTALQGMTGLVLGLYLKPEVAMAQSGAAQILRPDGSTGGFAPNAFVRIGNDDTVTVLVKHIEFGQGPFTGLATLVAEELNADWSKVRAEHAPADANLYKNFLLGSQGTGGSTAMANSYEQMRKAGAAARAMLVEAAAQSWRVPAGEISVERGVLRPARSGRRGRFGQFAQAGAQLPVPENVALKDAARFRLIGREGA